MKVLNEFDSHHYVFSYERVDYYCPNCGQKEVWVETSGGDYYMGETYACTSCEHFFYLPNGTAKPESKNYLNIVEQLKTGVTKEPSTPKGK